MKIHLTSANLSQTGPREQQARLRCLWEKSDRRHELVENEEEADFILVSNLAGKNWYQPLREHPKINQFPDRSFAVSDSDFPMPLLRGIYTSASRRMPFCGRYRSGAYNLYPQEFRNPHLESHSGRAHEIPKRHLFSFLGRDSSAVRLALFRQRMQRDDVLVQNTTSEFEAFGPEKAEKMGKSRRYVETLEQSKFALCPRGVGPASLRLFEAMSLGVAPIILSDDWIFPKGPDWSKCALLVPEREVPRLEEIASENEDRYREMGAEARKMHAHFFADEVYFNYLVDQMCDLVSTQRVPERWFWHARHVVVNGWKMKKRLRW